MIKWPYIIDVNKWCDKFEIFAYIIKKHTALKVKLVNVQLVSEDMNGISEYRILIATTINTMVTQAPIACDDISW